MWYKILNAVQNEQIITLTVFFQLKDTTMITDVSVFSPTNIEQIYDACNNRCLSEQAYLDNIELCKTVLPDISLNVEIPVE